MDTKTRILYVMLTNQISGGEISIIDYIKHLDTTRFSPLVLCPSKGPLTQRLEKEGIPFVIQELHFFSFRNPFPFLKSVLTLRKIIKENKIDVLHANGLYTNQYSVLAAKLCNIPCITHIQNNHSQSEIRRYLANYTRKILVLSKHVMKEMSPFIKNPASLELLYHGVDLKRFHSKGSTKQKGARKLAIEYGIPKGRIFVGLFGLLEERKGHRFFLEAAKRLSDGKDKTHFVVVGDSLFTDDSYKDSLYAFVKENKMESFVHFTGFRENIPELMREMDIVVFPYIKEPLGLVLLEASACAKAMIGFASGGVEEIIVDKETGLLVPEKNVQGLTEGIRTLINSTALRSSLAGAARKNAVEHFDIQMNAKRLMEIYVELLN